MTEPFRKPRILIVDDDQTIRRVINQLLSKEEAYDIFQAADGKEGLRTARDVKPDLIISDYHMPEMDGFEFCCSVREDPELFSTVFILLTVDAEINKKIEGLGRGADDYLEKTQPPAILLGKVKAFLRIKMLQNALQVEKEKLAEANEVLERNFRELLSILLKILETTIPGTSDRAKVSKAMAEYMAEKLGLGKEEKKNIAVSVTLHEIGKIGLPEKIKDRGYDSLQTSEKAIFHQHPAIGAMIISSISGFKDAGSAVYHQLENYDGSGIPGGLMGEEISMGARILRVIVLHEEAVRAGLSTADRIHKIKSAMNKILDPLVASQATEFIIQHDAAYSHDKYKVQIDVLKAGMVIAEDIYSVSGVKLLPKGVKLQERMLQLITERSLTDPIIGGVYVYKE